MKKGKRLVSELTDILKAFIPVYLLLYVIPYPQECCYLPVLTGTAVVFGHMFPFWMQFRGGKGFASLLGFSLAVDWRMCLACVVLLGILLLVTRYIALATVSSAALVPVWHLVRTRDVLEFAVLAVVGVIIIVKHIPNLKRIANGTEIGFRKEQVTEKPQPDADEKSE